MKAGEGRRRGDVKNCWKAMCSHEYPLGEETWGMRGSQSVGCWEIKDAGGKRREKEGGVISERKG